MGAGAAWPRSGRCRPIAVGHGCVVQGYWAGVQPSGKVNVDGVGVLVRPATVDHHPSSQAASSVRREACGLVFLGCRSWRIVAPSPPTRPQAAGVGLATRSRPACLAGSSSRRAGLPLTDGDFASAPALSSRFLRSSPTIEPHFHGGSLSLAQADTTGLFLPYFVYRARSATFDAHRNTQVPFQRRDQRASLHLRDGWPHPFEQFSKPFSMAQIA